MKLEEKIKEIKDLCQNLNKKVRVTIKQSFPDNENIVLLNVGHIHSIFEIDDEEEYNKLIERLKENQKEPELYTLDEIKNGIEELFKQWFTYIPPHDVQSIKISISDYIKPYKK